MEELNLEMIQDAWDYLQQITHRTDLTTSNTTNERLGKEVFFKMENMQKTGSFKLRGSSYKIHKLTPEELAKGVVSSSAGNHAQGVAMAANTAGVKAKIFMPETSPKAKVEAAEGYKAEVVLVGETYSDAGDAAEAYLKEHDVTYVHPYDDYYVMAGQGTIALEMLEQEPDLDMIIAPLGGGGLLSGIAVAAKSIKPSIKVIGVEAAAFPSMKEAVETGELKRLPSNESIAEGIAVREPGQKTYQVIKEYVDEIVTVTEEEIAEAIIWMLERNKTLVEGAGATPLAACFSHPKLLESVEKIGLVVSGGNIDLSSMPRVQDIARGIKKAVSTSQEEQKK